MKATCKLKGCNWQMVYPDPSQSRYVNPPDVCGACGGPLEHRAETMYERDRGVTGLILKRDWYDLRRRVIQLEEENAALRQGCEAVRA